MLKELLAANIDLYIDQGDTYYKTFTIKDNNGLAIDLTNVTIEANMKRYMNTGTNYQLDATIVTPLTGSIALSMTELNTNKLVNDRYVYTVKLRDATSSVKIMSGQVLVENTSAVISNINTVTGNSSILSNDLVTPIVE